MEKLVEKITVHKGYLQLGCVFKDEKGKVIKKTKGGWFDSEKGKLYWVHNEDGSKQGVGFTYESAVQNYLKDKGDENAE